MPRAGLNDRRFTAVTVADLLALRKFIEDHAANDWRESPFYWQALSERLYIEIRANQ